MSLHKTYTDTERAALRLHGLNTEGPSQLSDAFVCGLRYATQKAVEAVQAAGPKDGPIKLVSDGFAAAITAGVPVGQGKPVPDHTPMESSGGEREVNRD